MTEELTVDLKEKLEELESKIDTAIDEVGALHREFIHRTDCIWERFDEVLEKLKRVGFDAEDIHELLKERVVPLLL